MNEDAGHKHDVVRSLCPVTEERSFLNLEAGLAGALGGRGVYLDAGQLGGWSESPEGDQVETYVAAKLDGRADLLCSSQRAAEVRRLGGQKLVVLISGDVFVSEFTAPEALLVGQVTVHALLLALIVAGNWIFRV